MIKFKKPYKIELAPTLSGHWYKVSLGKKVLGYYPSATTILNAYPQSLQLTKWIADQGWNEAQKIKSEAGVRGTNVHTGVDLLLQKKELFRGNYSLEEWFRLNSFVDWFKEYQPKILATELALFSPTVGYTGTADVVAEFQGKVCIGDWKTSSAIHENFPLQVASYAFALEEMTGLKVENTFILQLGAKNKKNYRYVLYPEWRDHFEVFKNVKATWQYDNKVDVDFEPPVLVLPETLKI